jgi:Leucine-rich repeat (LRR) protein
VKEKVFVSNVQSVTQLDLFQSQCTNIKAARYFTNLQCFQVLMQPSVSVIAGLESLQHLTSLWITQCSLTEIAGLEGLRSLKQLHLSSNKISKIEGLENLQSLEVLWLNDNRLRAIDGMGSLTRLKTLWLARNQIETIGSALDTNAALSELNLADNKIGCFKELLHLGRLPALRSLSFCDPHFGDNPVCGLCNYQVTKLALSRSSPCSRLTPPLVTPVTTAATPVRARSATTTRPTCSTTCGSSPPSTPCASPTRLRRRRRPPT